MKVPFTDELLVSAASARQKYEQALETQRQQKATDQQLLIRRAVVEEIETFKKQKKNKLTLMWSMHLEMTADKLLEKAETTEKIQFVAEANGLRRSAKEKRKLLPNLQRQLKRVN
ncbi:hypothetical protein DPMN_027869 [Dreissena polymorpha]|uniref:Uncharacterized protein n=1 Tax=Dreissena polymorpha TaxID=45954 RepID=A0A9D4RFX6_DREPO|nr:hypothetical protein DPMN_027869 [Dreissena polymorpha]